MKPEELVGILRSIELPDCPLAFSGGLDSSILAAISESCLYSIGLKGSYDLQNSKRVAEILGRELNQIQVSEADVEAAIQQTTRLVGTSQLDLEIGASFYLLLKNLPEKVSCLILGQGADELFGGYKRYEGLVGTEMLERELKKDADELHSILERRELRIAEHFGIILHFPYLDPRVRDFASELPVEEKVSTGGRKLILRDVGKLLGLSPEICSQPKKAIQYGTGISKLVRKHLKEVNSS